jgi:hypothetical protein
MHALLHMLPQGGAGISYRRQKAHRERNRPVKIAFHDSPGGAGFRQRGQPHIVDGYGYHQIETQRTVDNLRIPR